MPWFTTIQDTVTNCSRIDFVKMQHLAGAKPFGGSHRLWPLHWGLLCFTIHYLFHFIGRIPTKTGNLSKNQHFLWEVWHGFSLKGKHCFQRLKSAGRSIEFRLRLWRKHQVVPFVDSVGKIRWEQGNMEMKGSDTRRCCEQPFFF